MKQRILLVVMLFISFSVLGQVNNIPKQAYDHRETIVAELTELFPTIYDFNYVPALIEHESCITLKHKKCWNSTSELKSAREQGVGLGQITRAYHSDGRLRFDSLTELRNKYKVHLAEVTWNNVKQRSDLQIRMIVLMLRDNWSRLGMIPDPYQRMSMVDAAYNGGLGGLNKERRQCNLTKGCDATVWFGNVEKHCMKSKNILYGNRSACDINRHHVTDVMKVRLPKYQKFYGM